MVGTGTDRYVRSVNALRCIRRAMRTSGVRYRAVMVLGAEGSRASLGVQSVVILDTSRFRPGKRIRQLLHWVDSCDAARAGGNECTSDWNRRFLARVLQMWSVVDAENAASRRWGCLKRATPQAEGDGATCLTPVAWRTRLARWRPRSTSTDARTVCSSPPGSWPTASVSISFPHPVGSASSHIVLFIEPVVPL